MVQAAGPKQLLNLINAAESSDWSPGQGRIIGISHRVKRKKDQEARPTLIAIREAGSTDVQRFKLETEQSELDFLNGQCAVKWRAVASDEDISGMIEHQVIFRAAKDEDVLTKRHPSQCRHDTKKNKKGAPDTVTLVEVAEKVPTDWIGLQRYDIVVMTLGGSGDYFAYALSRKLSEMNGSVMRIPPFKLKDHRGAASKDDDPMLLAHLVEECRGDFYATRVRDLGIIRLRNVYREWKDAMKARIACDQRLFQHHIGDTFCSEAGGFPEGSIEKEFKKRKATDAVLVALEAEESVRLKKLIGAVEALDVYQKVFADIPGLGPRIAARLVYAVVDIRRFKKASQFVAYNGLHVRQKDKSGNPLPPEKQFPRHRNGECGNWDEENGRQAFYLLADQFNRQGGKTRWSKYLIDTKARMRDKHPEPVPVIVKVDGKEKKVKRYTNGHIHKMAIWRTLTRFAEWLHGEWWKLERSAVESSSKE